MKAGLPPTMQESCSITSPTSMSYSLFCVATRPLTGRSSNSQAAPPHSHLHLSWPPSGMCSASDFTRYLPLLARWRIAVPRRMVHITATFDRIPRQLGNYLTIDDVADWAVRQARGPPATHHPIRSALRPTPPISSLNPPLAHRTSIFVAEASSPSDAQVVDQLTPPVRPVLVLSTKATSAAVARLVPALLLGWQRVAC